MSDLSQPFGVWHRGESEAELAEREWLVTNGLGGYASGTLAGPPSRRYHGLLIAALAPPAGRVIVGAELQDAIVPPRQEDASRTPEPRPLGAAMLREVVLERGLPLWRFEIDGALLERRIAMLHGQNTTLVTYRLEGRPGVRLVLRPFVRFQHPEDSVAQHVEGLRMVPGPHGWEVAPPGGRPFPTLRIGVVEGAAQVHDDPCSHEVHYAVEERRGYAAFGRTDSPGRIEVELREGAAVTLAATCEPWETFAGFSSSAALADELRRRDELVQAAHPALHEGMGAQLVLAADAFVVAPQRVAAGDGGRLHPRHRSVIAGYHWFTDWGRDTMISLEGLTLVTGRYEEARAILRTFGDSVRDGLLPNLFPEGTREGLYHTADATWWFFHAIDRYVQATRDTTILRELLPTLEGIVAMHEAGTRFGIRLDPADGLLTQGAPDLPLTWMDAKVDGWVVTPRRGKPVEINALVHNGLRLLAGWTGNERFGQLADRLRRSFDERFWNPGTGFLFDVVDGEHGDDPSLRPNQLFAIALPHPVLDRSRWAPVVDACTRALLTPFGLRSLAPGSPDYKHRYDGDLRSRDAAYHQGTVWGWLIGPYFDALRRVRSVDAAEAARLFDGFERHLREAGVGSISEIFDAEGGFTPRGCIAQAWSVAEVLRGLVTLASAPPRPMGTASD